MRSLLIPLTLLSLALLSCGESEPPPSLTELRATAPILKIKVMADGSILADDQPATLEELTPRFTELAQANGMVWYYRQDAGSAPHPIARDVISMLVDHQLPISLSTQPDFSDIIKKTANTDTNSDQNEQ